MCSGSSSKIVIKLRCKPQKTLLPLHTNRDKYIATHVAALISGGRDVNVDCRVKTEDNICTSNAPGLWYRLAFVVQA